MAVSTQSKEWAGNIPMNSGIVIGLPLIMTRMIGTSTMREMEGPYTTVLMEVVQEVGLAAGESKDGSVLA